MSAEVLTTLSTTVGMILAISGGFAWMIHRMDHAIDTLRTELKRDIAELRTELKGDIAELRTELKGDISDSRTGLKRDIADLRADVVQLQVGMARLEGRFEG